jgi:hypothetical protein
MDAPSGTQICKSKSCSQKPQPLGNFALCTKDSKNGKKGQLTSKCKVCMEKDRNSKRKKRAVGKEDKKSLEWDNMPMEDFLGNVAHADVEDVDLRVSVDTMDYIPLDIDSESRAKGIATLLNDVMNLHWM